MGSFPETCNDPEIVKKKTRCQYPAILTVQVSSMKDLLYGQRAKSQAGKMTPSRPLGSYRVT